MKDILNQIKKTEWYKQAGNSKVYYIFPPCRGAADHLGTDLTIWSLKDRKLMEWVSPRKNFIDTATNALDKQKKDHAFIDKHMAVCEKKSLALEKFYEKFLKKDPSTFDLKKVIATLQELEKLSYDYWLDAYLCDAFDPEGDKMLKEEIEKHKITLDENEIAVFMRTSWLNYMQEERLDMLNLAKKVKGKKCSIKNAHVELEKHAMKFFYVDNSWESTTVLMVNDFAKRLDATLHGDIDKQIAELETNWEEKHTELQEKHSIPDELMNVFYFFSQLFKLRDQRKKHTLLSNHVYDMLFQCIGELFDIRFKHLAVIAAEEITEQTTTEDLKKKISEREDIILEVYSKKKTDFYEGEEGMEIDTAIQKTFAHKGDTIKGTPACKGVVQGVVRVIRGEVHFSKFNKGEILVAPMTRPEYLPLMKKAKAIVTDEGGVTCHAAIVSRELGVPCIIGTGVATQKLHDGELVEVDADKGVVKRL